MAKRTSKSGKGSGSSKRSASTGEFTIGDSFRSISSVEGITMSRGMAGDFRRTQGMTPDQRRSTLSDKYGKKKK